MPPRATSGHDSVFWPAGSGVYVNARNLRMICQDAASLVGSKTYHSVIQSKTERIKTALANGAGSRHCAQPLASMIDQGTPWYSSEGLMLTSIQISIGSSARIQMNWSVWQ